MLKACPRCGGIHKHGECPIPYKRRYGKVHNGTKEYKFRSSAQWQKKRAEILSRDMYLCRLCMDNGRLMINNLQVHHIIPISVDDSLKLDNDNLITLCPRCHHEVEGHSEYVKVLKNLATSEVELK